MVRKWRKEVSSLDEERNRDLLKDRNRYKKGNNKKPRCIGDLVCDAERRAGLHDESPNRLVMAVVRGMYYRCAAFL